MTSDLIILTGPPGAGKSTVGAKVARRSPRGVHLHTDDFWHAIVAGAIPPWTAASRAQNETVIEAIASAAFIYADGDFQTLVDGVVGPWMVNHFRQRMSVYPHVRVHYVVLRPDRQTTLARARARLDGSALTDPEPLTAMWDQFADLGVLEGHVLDTTDDTLAGTISRVTSGVEAGTHRL